MSRRQPNQKGIALITVLVFGSTITAIAIAIFNYMNSSRVQSHVTTQFFRNKEFVSRVTQILDSERFCRLSIAGDGPQGKPVNPVFFYKQNHDDPSKPVEGLPIELFYGNHLGNRRTTKFISGEDQTKNYWNGLKIIEMELFFDASRDGNYQDASNHSEIANLFIKTEYKTSHLTSREKTFRFPLYVNLSTFEGKSKIVSCSLLAENLYGNPPNQHIDYDKAAKEFCERKYDWSWDSTDLICRPLGKYFFNILVSFKLKFNGEQWSITKTQILFAKNKDDYKKSVVLGPAQDINGDQTRFQFPLGFGSHNFKSREILSLQLIENSKQTSKLTLHNSKSSVVDIIKSDDTTLNEFQSGDEIQIIAAAPGP